MKYGERLKLARLCAGLTQGELAGAVGLRRASIAYLETGDAGGSEYTAQFAHVCGVRAMWLAVEHGGMSEDRRDDLHCPECRGVREIRHPYSAVERIPCPICAGSPLQPLPAQDLVVPKATADALRSDTCGDWDADRRRGTSWLIEIDGDVVQLKRLHEGKVCESYRHVDRATAVIWAAAIIQGYQPPRDLRHQGKPVG